MRTSVKTGMWLLLGGIAAVGIGLALIGSIVDPSGARCNQNVVSAGDSCYGRAAGRSNGYERRVARAEQDTATSGEIGPLLLVIGAILAVGGTAALVRHQCVRAQASAIAADVDRWNGLYWL